MKQHFLLLFIFTISAISSFSQKVERDYKVFEYTVINNARNKFPVTGVWCPKDIKGCNIMCIQTSLPGYRKKYLFIESEKYANVWVENLAAMKALFLKNDSIAKKNGVTSEISKNVSEKFDFLGQCGESLTIYAASYRGPIVKKYSGNGYEYGFFVLYFYINGKSRMELHKGDFYLNNTEKVWTFESAEDFDEVIKAFNWSNFFNAFNGQVKEYQKQQDQIKAAEAKKQQESDLFD